MFHKKIPFSGLCTALITPFSEEGGPDLDAFRFLIERQIAAGVDALLVLGTTGEASTLTDEEKKTLIRTAAETVAGRIPLIAGTGSNDTAKTSALSEYAAGAGADALLLVTPYYNKTSPEGLVRHFAAAADRAECPVILYNIPSRTGVDIPLAAYEKLAAHPRIVGVKEASGSIARVADLCVHYPDSLAVYAGNDGEAVPVMSIGGRGLISVVSNLLPEETARMCHAMLSGNGKEAAAVQNRLYPLVRALFSEVNPIPVKAAAAMLGLCRETVRMPLLALDDEKRSELQKTLFEVMRK